MNFGFTEEQEMIRSQAAEFFKQEYPIAVVRESLNDEHGFNQDLWNKMSTLGWFSLVFPEEYRGAGLTFVELTVLLEQMGRALIPGGFFSTVLLGGLAILETCSSEQKSKWLTSIAEGKLKSTLAHIEPESNSDTNASVIARREDNGYVLNGTKLFVPDAHSADLILCTARSSRSSVPKEGMSLFAVDRRSAELNVTVLKTMDQTRRLYEVTLNQVYVPEDRLLGAIGQSSPAIEKVFCKATIGRCAEMVGGAQKMLDMCVDYAKQRIQFGRPIGSFQAIQHKCADMLLLIESARSAVYAAACTASEDSHDTALLASVAKAYTNDACRFVAGEAIQIHGGMGFTWEHDAHLYFKRAKADEFSFGDATYHRARVAELIGL
ncbi:MAG TPA: acyl-CoA dehydrogenase family protein [Pyrinomonadaceae bacterium]|jgi:alkylation response protein AidB-like acyl-CoA dehydrogenase|nr:acyl-CoA dehydrogenase family protein [Pyrinomonadaceae bacterium]